MCFIFGFVNTVSQGENFVNNVQVPSSRKQIKETCSGLET